MKVCKCKNNLVKHHLHHKKEPLIVYQDNDTKDSKACNYKLIGTQALYKNSKLKSKNQS